MEMGAKEPDTQLENTLKNIAINECCTLVYTVSNDLRSLRYRRFGLTV